jgi:CspA family cold shock protein
MPTGTVIYFNFKTEIGVIMKEKGGGIFVGPRAIQESDLVTLHVGQRLTFDIIENREGHKQAVNLKK